MDTFERADLRELTAAHVEPCVSVYLPTHVAGEQGQQDPVRLKNLLQQAEQRLSGGWLRPAEARQLLSAARELPNDPVFWNERSHGLAIFMAPGLFRHYRLPVSFEERVIVNRRFHVKPLLPLLTGEERFFILALSQNDVRFYTASRRESERIQVPGLPSNMEEALNYSGADRGAQVHSAMRGSLGKQAAVFHGQGGEADTHKQDLAQYFRLVDAALAPLLRDESAPLLLAGVRYLLPIYREVSAYSNIAEEELLGNCDYFADHEIHQRAWPLLAPRFQQAREEAAAKFRQLAGTGKASNDIHQIVPASLQGRVESLFVDTSSLQWGRFDPQTTTVELHDQPQTGDDDLLDLAVVQTLLSRGAVYPGKGEQMPNGASVAAVFRY